MAFIYEHGGDWTSLETNNLMFSAPVCKCYFRTFRESEGIRVFIKREKPSLSFHPPIAVWSFSTVHSWNSSVTWEIVGCRFSGSIPKLLKPETLTPPGDSDAAKAGALSSRWQRGQARELHRATTASCQLLGTWASRSTSLCLRFLLVGLMTVPASWAWCDG